MWISLLGIWMLPCALGRDSSLVARRVAVLHHALYASPSYLASRFALKHPDELRQHNCLRMKLGHFSEGMVATQGKGQAWSRVL